MQKEHLAICFTIVFLFWGIVCYTWGREGALQVGIVPLNIITQLYLSSSRLLLYENASYDDIF